MSVHHSGLLLLFASSSSMSLSCVPIDHSVCIWSCYAGDSPLNPAFNAGLTPFNAQTAVPFVNQTGKCFLSPLNFGICFKLTESMVQTFRFLCSLFCSLSHQLLLGFLK
jgi:hypothetical protein